MKKKMIHWSTSGIFLYGIATASPTYGQAITIDAPQGLTINAPQIHFKSNTIEPLGITINAPQITIQGNNIDAIQGIIINTSQFAIQGNTIALLQDIDVSAPPAISISALDVFNLAEENATINLWKAINIEDLLQPRCAANRKQANSQFIITGRGGLPPSPIEVLRSEQPLVDLGTAIQHETNRPIAAIAANSVKENLPLTTRSSTVTSHSPWLLAAKCHAPKTTS